MLECATFVLLKQRHRDVYYWRDRGEVDFVILRNGDPVPVRSARRRSGVNWMRWSPPSIAAESALIARVLARPGAPSC